MMLPYVIKLVYRMHLTVTADLLIVSKNIYYTSTMSIDFF